MNKVAVRNWERWQTYRSDRGTPPWIKIHRKLLSNPEWSTLSDSEKGQLVSIWIIAADKNGEIPSDPIVLRKVCSLDNQPDVNKFIRLGFLESFGCQDGVKMASTERQLDAPEERRGEESRIEERRDIVGPEPRPLPKIPFSDIVSFLNEKAGTAFKPGTQSTKSHIRARWAEGFRLEDFQAVIEHKTSEWKTDAKMSEFLRPVTLFGTKFEGYLNAAKAGAGQQNLYGIHGKWKDK
jgi:uncharacterized phage protein (TIGR02220 family)